MSQILETVQRNKIDPFFCAEITFIEIEIKEHKKYPRREGDNRGQIEGGGEEGAGGGEEG